MTAEAPALPGSSWSWRREVAFSALLLAFAAFLVRRVRLSHWRSTLGTIEPLGSTHADPANPQITGRVSALVASVERAALWLPFKTKCLPRAAALQWRMRLAGIPSQLVVAFHRTDRASEDRFHAWVEHAGAIVIGQCDRPAYQPVLVLAQGRGEPLTGRA